MDGHHEGSKFQFVEWTDPTKIKIHKSTKWTNTTGISYLNHQSGRTSEEINIWPTKVDEPSRLHYLKRTGPTKQIAREHFLNKVDGLIQSKISTE